MLSQKATKLVSVIGLLVIQLEALLCHSKWFIFTHLSLELVSQTHMTLIFAVSQLAFA